MLSTKVASGCGTGGRADGCIRACLYPVHPLPAYTFHVVILSSLDTLYALYTLYAAIYPVHSVRPARPTYPTYPAYPTKPT